MEIAKVTSKGQITIPVSIRRRLGVNEGDKLLFIDSPEGVVMVNPDKLSGSGDAKGAQTGPGGGKAVAKAAKHGAAEMISDEPVATSWEAAAAAQPGEPAAGAVSGESAAGAKTGEAAPVARPGDAATAAKPVSAAPGAHTQPDPQIKGVDIGALLEEIRSIGSKL